MTLSNAIRKRITELAKEKGISINMVATLAGIPHTTLLAFMNCTSNDPRATTLLHICEAFEIELKEPKEELDIVEIETKIITVDIKGAIEEPGVYEVEEGKRVQDVINLAQGLKENADVSLINLSKKVEDEMVIIIYTKEEILALQNEEKKQWKEVECPNTPIVNDACINEGENSSEESSKVSINQGNLEELMTLPGIGESKAQAIISYREQNGGFQQVEELLNVNGIGDTIFAQLEPYIIL